MQQYNCERNRTHPNEVQQAGKDVREMDADQEAMLLEIAQSHTQTAYCAQTLLYLARGYEYPVQLPDFSEFGIAGYNYTSFKTSNNTMPFVGKMGKVFPNPAAENINISYRLEEGEMSIVKLYNSTSSLLFEREVSGEGVLVNVLPGCLRVYMYAKLCSTQVKCCCGIN